MNRCSSSLGLVAVLVVLASCGGKGSEDHDGSSGGGTTGAGGRGGTTGAAGTTGAGGQGGTATGGTGTAGTVGGAGGTGPGGSTGGAGATGGGGQGGMPTGVAGTGGSIGSAGTGGSTGAAGTAAGGGQGGTATGGTGGTASGGAGTAGGGTAGSIGAAGTTGVGGRGGTGAVSDCRLASCTGLAYCDLATGECKPGCAFDSQCSSAANERCDITTHACVCGSGFHRCANVCVSDSATATCGTRCSPCPTDPNGTASCDGTSCNLICNADYRLCGGACASCPTAGATGFACAGTACVASTCSSGNHICGNKCASNASVDSCGTTSCSPCPGAANGTATCNGTSCGITCIMGYLACGGACAACPTANATGFSCSGAACVASACASGYHVCTGACVANTSIATCGASCTPCPTSPNGAPTCNGTSCGLACNQGYLACGGVCAACPAGSGPFSCSGTTCVPAGSLFPTGPDGPFDGRLLTLPCGDANLAGTDCANGGAYYQSTRIACVNGQLNVLHSYPVGGATGATYIITLHFYGIVEPKNYGTGVTREAGTGRPGNQNTGAAPTPWAVAPGGHTYPISDYNTWELRVDNELGQEVAAYYLNADTAEGHWTYVLNFSKQISVIGGGTIRMRHFDRNCRLIKNCGPAGTAANQCATLANARVIDVTAAMPTPAMTPAPQGGLLQPNLVTAFDADSSGQWLLIDLVSIDGMF